MPDTAEQISDTALRHHAAMLLVLPRTPAQGVEPWEVENKRLSALIAHLLLSCFIDLLSDSEPDQRALKELAEYVAEEGLFLCHIQDDDQYSHIWLQPKHFLYLAARTLRFHLHLRRINGATLMPHRPPSPVRPIAVGLTEKADALIRPLYGDAMPTHLDMRIATIIANNTPDADSALILMHGGADLRAVVEDILEAITLEGERTFTDTPPATFPEPRIGYELKPAAGTAAAACRRSRDAACYARDVQGQRWRRHDLSGRTVAAPPPYSSAGYSDGAASGGAALPAQQRGPGPGAATITPQDLFSGFASAGRASMDTSQRNSSSGAAAYLVPPPAPVGPVATHTRAPAAAAAAATASSSRASGDGCRFVGVPPNAKFTPVEETSGTHMVLPERRGRALCSHFQKHGWCELGDHCAMAHPSGRSVRFNLLGYPIRPGQRVCKFFLEHGKCKFGKNCKFNHPNIAFKEGPYAGSMVRAAGMLGQNFYSSAF